jgi:hypothetical protein
MRADEGGLWRWTAHVGVRGTAAVRSSAVHLHVAVEEKVVDYLDGAA